jgi:hypothetical protein
MLVNAMRFCVLAVVGLMLVGCGESSGLQGIDVPGTITLDGQPLDMGMVVLEPEKGGENRATQITPGGKFTVYGVVPGRYKVSVKTSMYARVASQQTVGGKAITRATQQQGTFRAVPAKFEDLNTSNLSAEVKPDEPITLELKSA